MQVPVMLSYRPKILPSFLTILFREMDEGFDVYMHFHISKEGIF